MFRERPEYKQILLRIKKALAGCGITELRNIKATNLVGKLKVEGLEELMLSTWAMVRYIMKYLEEIGCNYHGVKVGDLHLAIENMSQYVSPEKPHAFFVTHEAESMEAVSRAAYSWMKAFRMLKGQERISYLYEDMD